MADFEDMTRAELVDLCTERGLPTYGAKPALAERLRAAGEAAAPGSSLTPHVCVTSDGMRIACLCSMGEDHDESEMDRPRADPFADEEPDDGAESVDSEDAGESSDDEPEATSASAAPVRRFRATYDVDEWDDDTHDELCARVVAEAQAAGHRTRGGGHRVGGADRSHTYEVSVR